MLLKIIVLKCFWSIMKNYNKKYFFFKYIYKTKNKLYQMQTNSIKSKF